MFQETIDDLDDAKRFITGNSCEWAVVIDKGTGEVKIQYQKNIFLIFGGKL